MKKGRLLIIGGPTGIGKSEVGVKLAKHYNGIVVSADSMQIYKGLNIGTGKITEEEKEGIAHTMLDIVYPNEEYSVQKYFYDAKKIIDQAINAGKLPIIVGGTGLYINAIINEQNFANAEPDEEIRKKYKAIYAEKGAEYLHGLLSAADPVSASKIAANDIKRTIRALEIFEKTGKSKSDSIQQKNSEYDISFFILQTEREKLYNKINRRVDKMFESGWVDEVQGLLQYKNCRSMEAIGYKEISDALISGADPYKTIEQIKQNTRRYAKRQITFFKWIKAQKHFVNEDFFENITKIYDNTVGDNQCNPTS